MTNDQVSDFFLKLSDLGFSEEFGIFMEQQKSLSKFLCPQHDYLFLG